MMTRTKQLLVAGTAMVILGAGAGGAFAANNNDDDRNVTGPEADRAKAAALTATNGGKANSVERDHENGAFWEVEVTKKNGRTVDVRLSKSYQVVVIESDSEAGDKGDPDKGDEGRAGR